MDAADVTIIVPTRDELHNIGPFLASLPDCMSLIVVDASDDGTPDLIGILRPHQTQIVRSKSTIPEARQLGAELARTDWLLFTDADVEFPGGYFDCLATQPDADVLYGPKLSRDRFRNYYRFFSYGQRCSDWLGIPAATGSNLVVRREVLFAVGGFNPELVCNEDSEVIWRTKRAGYRVRFAPELFVYARDHRRLELGLWRKTLHSVFRCLLLYWNLIPARWRSQDWGYWSHLNRDEQKSGIHIE
jgi:glycosyltransferase involved in cell wall biosynthesis